MVAAAAMLLVGLAVNYASHYASLRSADVETPEMSSANRRLEAGENGG